MKPAAIRERGAARQPDRDRVPLGVEHLGSWTVWREAADAGCQLSWTKPVWVDPSGSLTLHGAGGEPGDYVLVFLGLAAAWVSPARRLVRLRALRRDVARSTLDHFLYDQIAPRVLADARHLVLHAAGLARDGVAIAILGPSGRGKSTLAASLATAGWRLMGDDAVIATRQENTHLGQAIYPSLRLRPDSIDALALGSRERGVVADYTVKKNLAPGETAPGGDPALPLAALFFLSESSETGEDRSVRLDGMKASQACLGMIESSFCLDPTDSLAASERLALAAGLANAVPACALSYPRAYDMLPLVHEAIGAKVDSLRPTKKSASAA